MARIHTIRKRRLKPGTVLSPTPAVLVTVQGLDGKPNIITLAWVGVVCSDPPMMSISIRPSRHSHRLVEESGAFVINIPSEKLVRETDYCGVVSGRNEDKFEGAGLTPVPAEKVSAPLILECVRSTSSVRCGRRCDSAHTICTSERSSPSTRTKP